MRAILQRGIDRFGSLSLLFCIVGVLADCCGCTPAIGEHSWPAYTGSNGVQIGITTSPPLQENALVQVARDPFAAPSPALEPEPPARPKPAPHAKGRLGTDPPGINVWGEGQKYRELLREIDAEGDRASYGEFYDYGHWSGTSWAGHTDLPPGYWVYVAPNWYIFAEASGVASPQNPAKLGRRKYGTLLQKIKVEQDAKSYGEYYDYGYYTGTSYHDHRDLPPGYWVYVAPDWYIFEEANPLPVNSIPKPATPRRSWGPEQATGPPDTPQAGDLTTAWAASSASGQNEWLRLYYAKPVIPAAVHVYETYNPGALFRITARKPDGQEVDVWFGEDPVPVGSGKGRAAIVIQADFPTNRITIHLKCKEVPGWNEIDAVGLMDVAEDVWWAVAAEASSTYASPRPVSITPRSNRQRIEQLESQVQQLRDELRLRQRIQ